MFFKYQSASCILKFGDGFARLTNLYSTNPGQGHASMLMREVIDFADKHGVILVLEVGQYGNPRGLNNDQLKVFYEKYEFVSAGGRVMKRTPKKESHEQALGQGSSSVSRV